MTHPVEVVRLRVEVAVLREAQERLLQDRETLHRLLQEARLREMPCTVCLDRDGVLEVIALVTGPARQRAEELVKRAALAPQGGGDE